MILVQLTIEAMKMPNSMLILMMMMQMMCCASIVAMIYEYDLVQLTIAKIIILLMVMMMKLM